MPNQRTAVVTGASSGFGRLSAEAFAADGWRVYATMRNSNSGNASAAEELRRAGITVVELDVTDDRSVEGAAQKILTEAGAVDVLVNNAGTAYFGIHRREAVRDQRVRTAARESRVLAVDAGTAQWPHHLRFVGRGPARAAV
jgi:NAD(P)-dependent dehydrogenase (short-subunit alcohol dehydrogenase family)